jgi:hypothetical protein
MCACYFKPTAYVRASTPARIARPGCPIQPRPKQQLDKCMPRGVNLSRGWRNLLVHAGGIWGWKNGGPKQVSEYSLGMRQRLFQEFGNASTSPEPRIYITSSRVDDSEWTHSKYCLAPAGDGWGIRMAKSAALNCVPLIAQPYVVQGFEDLLPYERFSLRLEFDQVPRLPAMLRTQGQSRIVQCMLNGAPERPIPCRPHNHSGSPLARASLGRLCSVPTRNMNNEVRAYHGVL